MKAALIKKTGIGLLVAGLLTVFAGFLGVGYAGAVTPDWDANDNAHLNPSQQGATNPGFNQTDNESADCGEAPDGATWGWYFVLPAGKANGADTIVTLDVNFQTYGFHKDVAFTHPGKTWKAVVWTPTADTLLDAKAYTTTNDGSGEGEFNLSHVCAGETNSSSSSSSSETTSSSSTETTSSSSVENSSSSTESTTQSSGVEETSSSSNTAVLGEEVTRSNELARTGFDPTAMLAIGIAIMLGGVLLLGGARQLAKRER